MSTLLSIHGNQFHINGHLTYSNRSFQGTPLDGLLLNARLVQAIFDDLNPDTHSRWTLPNGTPFHAENNTSEFIAMLPLWKRHGLLGVAFNLQGGSPEGYSNVQPWINSTFAPDGSLRQDYLNRLDRVLSQIDLLGMVPILGFFYFGQTDKLNDEQAVLRAVDNMTDWLMTRPYQNLLLEINNECDVRYDRHQPILGPQRVPELIERVQQRTHRRWPVSVSFSGGKVPTGEVIQLADYVLFHGNGQNHSQMKTLIDTIRNHPSYRGQPLVCNEDDHFDFDQPKNNFLTTIQSGASWGYFDYRMAGEPFEAGYQSMPCSWKIDHPRKQGFFTLLQSVTGGL